MLAGEKDGNAFHSGRLRRLHAGDRVLKDQAVIHCHGKSLGRDLENLRIRFPTLDIFHRYHCLEEMFRLRQWQNEIEVLSRSTGTDRLFESRGPQALEQSLRAPGNKRTPCCRAAVR